jgi:nucleotide-binding universal stress UspA family protein
LTIPPIVRSFATGMPMKVLVAYDFGDAAHQALEQGSREAKSLGATLGLCHVMPLMYEAEPFFSQFHQNALLDVAKNEAEARAAIEEKVRATAAGQAAEVFVERGVPYAEIIRRAETWGADLVVVGSHGRTGLARVLLGSVAERIVRHAHGSVLVARESRGSGVVVAATDLSEASLPVVEAAARAAERRNARLVVVTAVDWSYAAWGSVAGAPFGATPVVPPPEVQEQMRAAMRETMQRELERVRATGDVDVIDGSPASAVSEQAEKVGAKLIVVGTHGRTGLSRLALGSVAEHVVRSANCSVLVVRSGSIPATQPAK